MRYLAGGDPEQAARLLRWRVADALFEYERRLRQEARHSYEFEVLVWSVLAQASGKKAKKPPKRPKILSGVE